MSIRRVRGIIFLRDVFLLSFTAFGGPQGHFGMFLDMFVKKRAYLSEEDLLELYALCQVLPGPTSTQVITSLGYKIGGPNVAYLTLLVWAFPAITIMTALGVFVGSAEELNVSLHFLKYIEPIAIGVVAYSSYRILTTVINTKTGLTLMIVSTIASFILKSPYLFPILLVAGGLSTTWKYKQQPQKEREKIRINWSNLILWISVLLAAAILGGITRYQTVLIFENFYRNGSLIFGGGQVLVPLLYTEFVEFKNLLTPNEFIYGYGMVQSIPGPTFSFSAYIGALSINDLETSRRIWGAIMASLGIFLPGTFLIFFVIRFWEQLKKNRLIKSSLEGIHAVGAGMVVAATFMLFLLMEDSLTNYTFMIGTIASLFFTRIPTPFIVLGGVILGLVFA